MYKNALVYITTLILLAVFVLSIFDYRASNDPLIAMVGTVAFGLGLVGVAVSLALCVDRNRPSLNEIDE